MRYFIIAGEASGDLHAANLIKAIKEEDPEAEFAFMGGDKMARESRTPPIVHYREVAFMGFGQVLRNFFSIHRIGKLIQKCMVEFAPDVIIPVDFGGFNFRYILPFVHKNLPSAHLFYYIPPKIWAWKKSRVHTLKRYCSKVLCILPFEEKFLESYGISAFYAGNPCIDAVDKYRNSYGKEEYKEAVVRRSPSLSLSQKEHIVALLPGSRRQELRSNLALMLETLHSSYPHLYPIIAGAPGLTEADYAPFIPQNCPVPILFNATYELLAAAKFALVTSGTATLETALIGTPQVVCYRANGSRWMNWAFKKFFPIRYFSLVNLILDEPLVEELLAADASPHKLRLAIESLLLSPERITDGYKRLHTLLGETPSSQRAAREIVAQASLYKRS